MGTRIKMVRYETTEAIHIDGTPVGSFCWLGEVDSPRFAIYVVLPDTTPDGKSTSRLFTLHEGNNWARPGDKNGWDGDMDNPTFHPSIISGGWHGFIKSGYLET